MKDVDLFDVSPVTYPAYKGTNVGLRKGLSPADAARVARMARLDAQLAELKAS